MRSELADMQSGKDLGVAVDFSMKISPMYMVVVKNVNFTLRIIRKGTENRTANTGILPYTVQSSGCHILQTILRYCWKKSTERG